MFFFLYLPQDREKKAKKKATGSATLPDDEPAEAEDAVEEESTEVEKVSENAEAPVAVKTKIAKETGIRSRGKQRGLESVPKVIRKRKKSTNYWDWAAPAAGGVLLVILLVIGYYYYYLL